MSDIVFGFIAGCIVTVVIYTLIACAAEWEIFRRKRREFFSAAFNDRIGKR